MEAKLVMHHDDPPCEARLELDGRCPECKLHPDMQSTCFYYYCLHSPAEEHDLRHLQNHI